MALEGAGHQKPGQPGPIAHRQSEAEPAAAGDEACPMRQGQKGLGHERLLVQALARENLVVAWKRVKANRGSAGVDGRSITETAEHLKTHWPQVREDLLSGRYRPAPVRRVQIPKPGGA